MADTIQVTARSLELKRFVWNDDCPAWPVRVNGAISRPEARAWVTAPVLLAMIKAVATNTIDGFPFVDDEDAVESAAAIASSPRAMYEDRLVYDVTNYVINTGSLVPDEEIDTVGYEAIGED